MLYPIAIEPGDESGAWGVSVPDIKGCFSAGDTLDEAIKNAKEAIEGHLETLIEKFGKSLLHLLRYSTGQIAENMKGGFWCWLRLTRQSTWELQSGIRTGLKNHEGFVTTKAVIGIHLTQLTLHPYKPRSARL